MIPRGRILIVDDEANARSALSEILRDEGYATETAADGFKALGKLVEFDPDVVLTDLKMPGLDGLGLLKKGRETCPAAIFVIMTAFGTIDNAVQAVKQGAETYLTKPLNAETLTLAVARAVEKARLQREILRLRERLRERNVEGQVIAADPRMREVLQLVEQVATSRASVLISGESGTGKELIAQAIHDASPRAKRPLVRLNCAALVETLLESELFGHERGAFTGAVSRREGRFKQADGGTLFLDEVSELAPQTQVKLLRFLQERTFERVGGNETLRVDVRVIAATNRDLEQRIREGRFREDLYYRLNVVKIEIPPLRERCGDIPELAGFFLRRYAEENHKEIQGLTPEALELLLTHPWPGNVRELENVIERAVALASSLTIGLGDLPPELSGHAGDTSPRLVELPPQGCDLDEVLGELERRLLVQALERTGGARKRAATLLGVSFRSLRYRLAKYGLDSADDLDDEPPGS